jgi:16S rRNA (guanine966-N2)-methyltransferase
VLGELVTGARFLDLYAGTGAVGLEALSRGASRVVFVERHRPAARIIEANRVDLEVAESHSRLLVQPALTACRMLARSGEWFDLAWADPPFEAWQEGLEALALAFSSGVIRPTGVACLECPDRAQLEPPAPLFIERDLAGGASRLVLLRISDGLRTAKTRRRKDSAEGDDI